MKKMHLNDEIFSSVRDGKKSVEVRINDEKRKALKVGEIVEFHNRITDEVLLVKIINLKRDKTFSDLIDLFELEDFNIENKADLIERLYSIYTKEEEIEFGVVGIKIELI